MDIIEQIDKLHENDEHEKIIEIIEKIPSDERDVKLFSLLARAYNNIEKYDEALNNLMYIREDSIDDFLWNYRVGYAYYYKGNKENAEIYFKKAYDLDNEDTDAYNFYILCSEDRDNGINFNERVNRFWKWFEENEKVISDYMENKSDMSPDEIAEFVYNGVSLISSDLHFNFGGGYEFTFTIEGREYLFYLTPRIVDAMPEKLKSKWKFYPYMTNQNSENFNFKMYGKDFCFKEILVSAEFDEKTDLFNLEFYNEKLNEIDEDCAYNAFYIMLEHTIGENISSLYLGSVNKSDEEPYQAIELTKLYDFITNTIKNRGKKIISDPCNKYTVYECKPSDNFLREDIFLGNSCYMNLINDYINYKINSVVDISKMGARAVYLTYMFVDNKDNDFEDENINKNLLNEKNNITDELISIMGEGGKEIGIVLGSAIGTVAGYIDLLLYNQDEFIKRAEEILKKYNYKFKLFRFRRYSEVIKEFNNNYE